MTKKKWEKRIWIQTFQSERSNHDKNLYSTLHNLLIWKWNHNWTKFNTVVLSSVGESCQSYHEGEDKKPTKKKKGGVKIWGEYIQYVNGKCFWYSFMIKREKRKRKNKGNTKGTENKQKDDL